MKKRIVLKQLKACARTPQNWRGEDFTPTGRVSRRGTGAGGA